MCYLNACIEFNIVQLVDGKRFPTSTAENELKFFCLEINSALKSPSLCVCSLSDRINLRHKRQIGLFIGVLSKTLRH